MKKSNISTKGLSITFLSLFGLGMMGTYVYAQNANDRFSSQSNNLIFNEENDDFLSDPFNPDDGIQNQQAINNQRSDRNIQTRAARETAAGVVSNPNDPNGNPRGNVALQPTQSGTDQTFEETPFAPEGFRLGSFEGNAALRQAIGYSDNVSGNADGDAGAFSQTSVDLSLTSDFSRHQIQATLNANYDRPFDDAQVDRFQLLANASLRLDLVDGYTLTSTLGYNQQTQSFTNSSLTAGAVDTPIQEVYSGSLELARTDRRLQFSLRGSVDRTVEEDVNLGNGMIQSQEDQAQYLYQLTSRIGYELSPAITPFVEGTYGMREFDLQFDRNGNQRDSEIFQLRGGVEVDLSEKLTGEISAGYISEDFEDPTLETLDGFTLDAELNWSPVRDTQYILTLGTATNDSVQLNDNGSLLYNFRLDYEKQITSRLSFNAFTDYQLENNDAQNQVLTVGLGSEYFLNRHTAIIADIEYSDFRTNGTAQEFTETSATLGMLFQK